MSNAEHELIVNKMCGLFEMIDIDSLPSLVTQLLHLCKDEHIVIVFLKLRKYFSKYLYTPGTMNTNGEISR